MQSGSSFSVVLDPTPISHRCYVRDRIFVSLSGGSLTVNNPQFIVDESDSMLELLYSFFGQSSTTASHSFLWVLQNCMNIVK